jgi:hypothetical protein
MELFWTFMQMNASYIKSLCRKLYISISAGKTTAVAELFMNFFSYSSQKNVRVPQSLHSKTLPIHYPLLSYDSTSCIAWVIDNVIKCTAKNALKISDDLMMSRRRKLILYYRMIVFICSKVVCCSSNPSLPNIYVIRSIYTNCSSRRNK